MEFMAKSKVLIVQHAPWEQPGRILESLDDLGISSRTVNIAEQSKPDLPKFSQVCGLVIMGGPMGAQDYGRYPGLKVEAKLAKAAVSVGKPVLGICLGHQIIATALGAKLVTGKEGEHGYGPITKVAGHDFFSMWNRQVDVLHWHSDAVTLPPGAQLLAKSSRTKVQAYRIGSALGLQFHLEVTGTMLERWLDEPAMTKDLSTSQLSALRKDFARCDPQLLPLADAVFSGFAARCATYAASIAS